jgi:hypothetical protein
MKSSIKNRPLMDSPNVRGTNVPTLRYADEGIETEGRELEPLEAWLEVTAKAIPRAYPFASQWNEIVDRF